MSPTERVAAHGQALAAFEERVVRLEAAGDDALAAAWAQIAADHAWHSPAGRLASPIIDDVLRRIGLRACPRGARGVSAGGPQRVLHVATEVAGTGGHSRMAWRWIERDIARVPTVALTRQRVAVPSPLAEAVAARGGGIHHLAGHDALVRARALAALVDDADLVVLHVHPFEVVSAIALADRRGRPPVIHVNHADHCFWLGADVADTVVSTRTAASRLAVSRRGVAAGRTAILPVPVDPPVIAADRRAARRELGVPDDACVLLCVASAYKLEGIDDVGLLDLVAPVLDAHPEAVLIAVGPDDEGPWRRARTRTGGRVRALGTLPDTAAVLAAGDVFLDGYPCSSLTAALEAAAAGMCVVSHQPARPQAATYDIAEPALGDAHVRAATPASYALALARLVADRPARERAGAVSARAVAAMADHGAWLARLEHVYGRAAASAASAVPAAAPPIAPGPAIHEDAFLLRLHEASGMAIAPQTAVVRGGDAFPRDPAGGLTIVVHVRDDRAGLERLLASAVATCRGLDRVEAVVIDDGSRDDTASLLADLAGDVRVVTNPVPIGAAASWPAGLALAEGEAVLLVGAGVVLRPGWIEPLRVALALPGVNAVAPRVVGGRGDEICVLASLEALRAGAAVSPLEVSQSVVLGAAARPVPEAVA